MRPSGMYTGALVAVRVCRMSDSFELTLMVEPKPPDSDGHRKAMQAAPKPVRPRANMLTMPRFKNWRRVTPKASRSTGPAGTGGGALWRGGHAGSPGAGGER